MRRLMKLIQLTVMGGAVVAAATTVFAQGRDFAGSWKLDAEKSATTNAPPLVIITLTEKEFTARFGSETAQPMLFNLDGTERVIKERGVTTKAAWKGDKLVASVKMPAPATDEDGKPGPDSVTFSREGAWLVLEATMPDHGTTKLYFKKASVK